MGRAVKRPMGNPVGHPTGHTTGHTTGHPVCKFYIIIHGNHLISCQIARGMSHVATCVENAPYYAQWDVL